MEIRWTVRNAGNGPTTNPTWTDLIHFNSSIGVSYPIDEEEIKEQLFPGNDYRVVKTITIPKYIHGVYNVFIHTNELREEFEYESYDNNIGSSVSH